jgi:hypothetical protein
MLFSVDVHLRARKVRNSTGMVAVEMRQQDVPHIAGLITQSFDLLDGRLGRIEPRRCLPDPFAPKPQRLRDIIESDAGIDKRKTVVGLDQQTVTNHPRSLENAAGAVHETPPDRAHGAGVEMMDVHDKPFQETGACLPSFQP